MTIYNPYVGRIPYICSMKDKDPIVVFDVARQQIDIYKDIGPVASELSTPRTTLQSRLYKGIQYMGGKFVGYGTAHKSGRGGNKGDNQGFKSY